MSRFHIHIDAWEISPDFKHTLITRFDMADSDFAGHPEGAEGFEPPHHLTFKTPSGSEFKTVFDQIVDLAKSEEMRGYIEGEFLPFDDDIPCAPFNVNIVPPFEDLVLMSVPRGSFRGAEVHIVMDADRSDTRLRTLLHNMGLFSAYMLKPWGRAVIYTVGGTRELIDQLSGELRNYLLHVGGAVCGSIKEERIVAYWLSHSDIKLPPVAQSIRRH